MSSTVLTEAQLCNLALSLVGQRRLINNLLEETTEAIACAANYGPCRDMVLKEFPWTFATRRSNLAQLADVTRSGWSYVYELPSDFLKPQYIWNGMRFPPEEGRIPFALELNDDANGHVLATDQDDAELVYTAKVTTVALYSPGFVDAVVYLLASRLAPMLTAKPQLGLNFLAAYNQILMRAKAEDAQFGQADVQPESEFIRGRS